MKKNPNEWVSLSFTHQTDELLFLHPSNHHRGGRKRQEESWWLCWSSGLGSRRFRLPRRLSVWRMGSNRRCQEWENVNISLVTDVCRAAFNLLFPVLVFIFNVAHSPERWFYLCAVAFHDIMLRVIWNLFTNDIHLQPYHLHFKILYCFPRNPLDFASNGCKHFSSLRKCSCKTITQPFGNKGS